MKSGKKRKRKCEEKEVKKKLLKQIYKGSMIGLAFLTSVSLWYFNACINNEEKQYEKYLELLLVGILYSTVYWFFAKMYQAQKIGTHRLTELTYFHVLSYGITDFLLFLESIIWYHGFQRIAVWSYPLCFVIQIIIIIADVFICNRVFAKLDTPKKIIIIYGNEGYNRFLNKINAKRKRYRVMGCFADTSALNLLKTYIKDCESVYLYEVTKEVRKELVMFCDSIHKDIYITQDIDNLITMGFDISHTFDTPFIRTRRDFVKWYYPITKRLFDIISSSTALILLSPIIIVTAVCIKLYDRGPVFYRQIRLTKDHKEFQIYKFRSMVVNAEQKGARLASQNDSRITPIGKIIRATRIDELPQLVNILKGDMSLVGPRPERPEIEKIYLKELPEFALRLRVKAGLTGYAQVFGKYNTTPLDKLKLDLLYINQQSILLDLKIILYTIKIIFIPEAAEGIEEGKMTAGNG